MQERHIEFNPKKIFSRIMLTLIMLPIGIWFALGDTSVLSNIPKFDDPNFRKFLGWLTISLVFIGVGFLIKCLLSKNSGMIIDKVGIEDNSQIISKSVIFWKEIESIEKTSIGISLLTMPTIKITFKDSQQKPRYLSSKLLKISDEELQKEIESYWKKTTASKS